MTALSIRREKPWPAPILFLLLFCVPMLVGGVECELLRNPDRVWSYACWLNLALCGLGVVLPFALRPQVTNSAFLETVLLTRISAVEWLDDRTLRALRRVGAWAGLLWFAALVWHGACHVDLGWVIEWLPTVGLMSVVALYFSEARVQRMALTQTVLGIAFAVLAVAWEQGDTPVLILVWGLTLGLLALVRALLAGRVGVGPMEKGAPAPACKAFSRNPIVIRESYRTARRGGRWAMWLRRYSLLVLSVGYIMWEPATLQFPGWGWDCGGNVAVLLTAWALVAATCTYWTTVRVAVGDADNLAAVSGLSANEFMGGWVTWAMRARWREAIYLILFSAAFLGTFFLVYPSPEWTLFPPFYLSAIVTGLLASAAAARAGLHASKMGCQGWAAHAVYASWLIPSLALAWFPTVQFAVSLILIAPAIAFVALILAQALMRQAFASPR